jgi:hypothetical protein
VCLLFDRFGSFLRLAAGRSPLRAGDVTRASGGSACTVRPASDRAHRGRAAQLLRVSRRPAASRRKERVRTNAPHGRAHRAKRLRIKHGERSRLGPHVRRSRRKGAPGARTEGSTPGRVAPYNGGATLPTSGAAGVRGPPARGPKGARRAVLRRTTAGQPYPRPAQPA